MFLLAINKGILGQRPRATTSPTINKARVPGSGTALLCGAAEEVIGAAAREGSKIKTPPAPTVGLDLSGRAWPEARIKVATFTTVPPV